jgi:phosphoribosylcarboxyaminoimidazole (NCAIR) mutase
VTVSVTLVSGAVTYSVQFTNEDPFDSSITQTAVAHPVTALTSATASQTGSNSITSAAGTPAMVPMRAVRINTASGTGTIRVTITEQSTV